MYIFYFCKKFINNQQDAEDITSFVFLKLWESKDKVDTTSAKAFLSVSASHKCQDYLKMRRRYEEVISKTTIYDLEEIEIETAVIEYLYELSQDFSPQQKKIFLLKYKDGSEVKDISKSLGITPQTVSNILHTCLNRLRAIIKNRGIHHGESM
jgi:RNA polymerase sigma-70 factor (ECF subfamily)